ncbi:glucosamine inositolphosphorylceramide transferase family protein [Caulobacter segnis]
MGCAQEPWHLSYPQVFEADGEIWMLPEAYRSGALTLYRAAAFPDVWEPVVRLALDTPAMRRSRRSATTACGGWPIRRTARSAGNRDGCISPSPSGSQGLGGPIREIRSATIWRPVDPAARFGSRMACRVSPVQDCTRTYGGGIRKLTILKLDPERFEAEASSSRPAAWRGAAYLGASHVVGVRSGHPLRRQADRSFAVGPTRK